MFVWLVMRGADSDLIQLQVLHVTTKTLQGIARVFGTWALASEHAYDELVATLH